MTHENLKAAFLQGGAKESSRLLHELMRTSVREAFWQMMAEEVDSLCGKKYAPDPECTCQRAGSENGSVYLEGGKEAIRRPRVREKNGGGEVQLESYRAASSQESLFDGIVSMLEQGMPQRGAARGCPKGR